ncbi:WD repeat-containing protein 93 [Anableps anableps]
MAGAGKAVYAKPKPTLELSGVRQLPQTTNCLACTEDGRFLGLGHTQGLSVWCAFSFISVAEWLRPQVEITFIQMTRMAEMTYLLGTVDDMGVARVFGFHSDVIHLLNIINIMEDVNIRSIFLTFDLHEGGHYGAASVSCNGAVCLEVYQFPVEQWLRELEMVLSQRKVMNHDLCTQHFLLPCNRLSGDNEAKPVGLPVAIAVWWSGCCNLLQYLLQKPPKNKTGRTFNFFGFKYYKFLQAVDRAFCNQRFFCFLEADVTPMPEMLWPNAKEILCSAVSRCTCYVALGLEDAMVCIWDRRSATPLSIVLLPEETSALSRVQFGDNWSLSAQDCEIVPVEPVGVFVLCKNGAIYTVTAGQRMQSCTIQLAERRGTIVLKDVINRATVCYLTLPTSYQTASPYSPVYALNAKQQALFIRGDQNARSSDLSERRNQSQLFVFYFSQSDIIKPHIVSHSDPPRRQTTLCYGTLEEIFNLYLEQRVHSVNERNNALEQTWRKLQETAGTM